MKIAIIGTGAIATYLGNKVTSYGISIAAFVVRPGKERLGEAGVPYVSAVSDLPQGIDLLVECAGHDALRIHGVGALAAGIDVLTVSVGALAHDDLAAELRSATKRGCSKLHLATGAIGALDALRAARTGVLTLVKYTGRKPPVGWMGSPAEDQLDLENLTQEATHFTGSAREAALAYPKNANVAAAIALSSLGFDDTKVELIADPAVTSNIHHIEATGDFGEMAFTIAGNSLPDNPRSSALAAMSVLAALLERGKSIQF